MGACDVIRVIQVSRTKLPDWFHKFVEDEKWENGHGGYSGTFAEANGLRIADQVCDTQREAEIVIFGDDSEVDPKYGFCTDRGLAEKWGPAIAVQIKKPEWTADPVGKKTDPIWLVGGIFSS